MATESKTIPRWIWIVWGLLFIYHTLTITISPMPWFDETYFASMTLNFMDTGDFLPRIGPMLEAYYPQAKAYGPAYFMVTAVFFKTFGFGIMQMRLPALIFGFLFPLVVYKILAISNIKPFLKQMVLFLILFDPIYLQNIHSGRMDSMAILLAATGIYQLLLGFQKDQFWHYVLTGICFGLAILTTPRIAICLMGPGLIAFIYFLSQPGVKRFAGLAIIPVLTVSFYSIWVFWGFGGFTEAYNYFFGQPKETLYFKSMADAYIRPSRYVPVFQYPALTLMAIFSGLILYFRRSTEWIFWISVINLIAFYSLVNDTGIYSIFSMPWVYICLACAAQSFFSMERTQRAMQIGMTCLILLNLAIFSLKNTVIWLFSESRDTHLVQEQINVSIPKGSRVIGDEAYYYFVLKAGSDFQYLDRGAGTPQRFDYHENVYKYQYVVVRNPLSNKYEFDFYNNPRPYTKVADIRMPRPGPLAQNLRNLLGVIHIDIPRGYDGTVYRR